ncbi:MAG TPA: DUF3226 domain-containing protein [Candidatus Binatia bacterium]|jgi:hypothetical protein|nr:DUF3226 domain-containing protein [Candidatus Binatia bacterium]
MNGQNPGVGPKPIAETRVLVGEGREEVLFFGALLVHLGIHGIQVEECKGKDGLPLYLRTLKVRTGFAGLMKLGIVRDADDNPTGAASRVDTAVAQAGFPAHIAVTRLILPGAGKPGALENLCLETIAGHPIETCIETFIECAARATRITHSGTTRKAKARVRTWLASHAEPDLRLGHVAEKGWLNWDAPPFAELIQFFRALA